MSLIINGTTIPSSGTVKYGNTDLKKVICNGVTVWEKIVFETKDVSYNGGVQCVTVPPGLYKLEVWGAQGGNSIKGGGVGGYGGYSCRYYYFSQQTALYVCVGGQGKAQLTGNPVSPVAGGYNGGENWKTFVTYTLLGASGGGCTHISKDASGVLSDFEYSKDKVLVVAGGGGGASFIDDNNGSYIGARGDGGVGGGLSGGTGVPRHSFPNFGLNMGEGGTQSSGGKSHSNGYEGTIYAGVEVYTRNGSFGRGGFASHSAWCGGGGGGGWYGGGSGMNYNGASPGGGGSGYIGVSTITHNGITYTNISTAGVNTGNGKAKITYVSS